MKCIDSLAFCLSGRSAVTIGKFDGIHRGHQKILESVIRNAKEEKTESVVFTFRHGGKLSPAGAGGYLTPHKERYSFLEQMGIDYLVECPFTDELRTMDADHFIKEILSERLHVSYLAVGSDFGFGYRRQGNCALLDREKEKYGFYLDIFQKLKYNEREISSSAVREAVRAGRMEEAGAMLGRPYSFEGRVVHGKALGHTIGFPTLNLIPDEEKLLPPKGVYDTKVLIGEKEYQGVANIGMQPTVSGNRMVLEVYVLDFDRMVYGEEIQVQMLHFERPEQKFSGIEELTGQLKRDAENCRKYFL